MDDFDWIENTPNPWKGVPQEDFDQLTDEERDVIEVAFKWNTEQSEQWNDCTPTYDIEELIFVTTNRYHRVYLHFTQTCSSPNHHSSDFLAGSDDLILYIDRNGLEWEIV